MSIKRFIDRPLLSIVINVMVVAVGIIALTRLPIEKFPDIAPPTVYLWASYPGASAETVQKSVVAPLEQAINGVDNMMYITSSASNGSASISIYFKQGTNADMAAAGFSINMLTLFALVLVIGTVVDDSIVVVEAVQARFDAGYRSAYKASVDAMNGLTSALFTTTLVFMVIFIPVSFVSGTSGTFYKQFGLTMAVAVGISLLYALTLAPALCALILRPHRSR